MVRFSKSAWILLGGVGTLWYANLVVLIVAYTDYPGSAALREYKLLIGLVFFVTTACFRQVYAMKKQDSVEDDD
jgi:hypothetical protein